MRHIQTLLLILTATPILAATEPCRPIEGLAPLLVPKSVIFFGELHGTVEAPAFVGDVLCHALAAGQKVTLALEVPQEESGRFDAFLGSDGGEAARSALLAGPFWTRSYQDGRSSRAMFDLAERARALRASGLPVELFLFDAAEPTRSRDLEMGNRLAAAVAAAPERMFLALAGNFHSQLTKGRQGYPDFVPMGFVLQERLGKRPVLALDILYSGGTAWTCDPSGTCGERKVGGAEGGAAWSVSAGPEPVQRGHHGRYFLGEIHASPPAGLKPEA
jgi:hypothetical protein